MKRFIQYKLLFVLAFAGTSPAVAEKEYPIQSFTPTIPNETPPDYGVLEINPESLHFEFAPMIKPGEFMMGSDPKLEPERIDSETLHKVTLTKPFWLLKTEVTQALFEDVMGYNSAKKCSDCWDPEYPATNVSPKQVNQFIKALEKRLRAAGDDCHYFLPTEAQWEYAVRAGTMTRWFFGDDENELQDYAQTRISKVGELRPNPWGLYDVYGSVEELVADYYAPHPAEAKTNPLQKRGSVPVTKGGFYRNAILSQDPQLKKISAKADVLWTRSAARSTFRDGAGRTEVGLDWVGFRIAKSCPDDQIEVSGSSYTDLSRPSVRKGQLRLKSKGGGRDLPHLVFEEGEYEIQIHWDVKDSSLRDSLLQCKSGDEIQVTGEVSDEKKIIHAKSIRKVVPRRPVFKERESTSRPLGADREIPIVVNDENPILSPVSDDSAEKRPNPWVAASYGYQNSPIIYGPNGGTDPTTKKYFDLNGIRIPSPPKDGWKFGLNGARLNADGDHEIVCEPGKEPRLVPYKPR